MPSHAVETDLPNITCTHVLKAGQNGCTSRPVAELAACANSIAHEKWQAIQQFLPATMRLLEQLTPDTHRVTGNSQSKSGGGAGIKRTQRRLLYSGYNCRPQTWTQAFISTSAAAVLHVSSARFLLGMLGQGRPLHAVLC